MKMNKINQSEIDNPQMDELTVKMSQLIDDLDAAEKICKPVSWRWIGINGIVAAACAGLVAAFLIWNKQPEDTFDDPTYAYAEVERILDRITEKTSPAISQIEYAQSTIQAQLEIFEHPINAPGKD